MLKTALLLTLLLGISGCSLLKPHYNAQQMHSYLFNKFDEDGDGLITKEEYFDFIEYRFDQMDLDGDGIITKEELYNSRFYTYLPALAQAVFRDSDLDKSGTVTYKEMVKSEEIRFSQMDRDQDGALTPEEFMVNNMDEFI